MRFVMGMLEGAGIVLGVWLLKQWAQRHGWVRKPSEMVSLFGRPQK